MATEPTLSFSVVSVVEDVLQKHGRLSDIDLASRKAQIACIYIFSYLHSCNFNPILTMFVNLFAYC